VWSSGRKEKAAKILSVLQKAHDNPQEKAILDIGCSIGIITSELSKHYKFTVGIDVDGAALEHAISSRRAGKLEFMFGSGCEMPLRSNTFDVVVAHQVFELIPDKIALAKEIYRVLKPGGICCVGATNRLYVMLIDRLPEKVCKMYTKTLWRGESNLGQPSSYWELKKLFRMFHMEDKTADLLKTPKEYNVEKEIPKQLAWVFKILPYRIIKLFIPLCLSF